MPKGKAPHTDPPVRVTFTIPESVVSRMDSVLRGSGIDPPYGSRSGLITRLLREFLERIKQ